MLCSRLFYYPFLALESEIIQCVIENEFERELRPDVIAAIDSQKIALADDEDVDVFLAQYSHSATSLPDGWLFCDSLSATKLKEDVASLTLRFANGIAVNPLSKRTRDSPIVLSRTEINRIERSLYQYETYCNLLRRMQYDPPAYCTNLTFLQRREIFFDKFAPWEHEQFVAIYEYLWSCVSKGIGPPHIRLAPVC